MELSPHHEPTELPKLRSGLSDVMHVDGHGVIPTLTSTSRFSGMGLDMIGPQRSASLLAAGHGARQSTWQQTAALVIADIVGTGVLSLSGNFAKLGVWSGISALVICYPLNFFTGILLNRLHLAFPLSVTYGDVGFKLVGKWGQQLGFASLYVYMFFLLGSYYIVIRKTIQEILIEAQLCAVHACFIGFLLLLPSNQLRTLHHLSKLSIVSFATIVVVLVMCIGVLLFDSHPSCGTQLPSLDVMGVFNALSGFVFAFSGQKIFLEMQAEMTEPTEFPKALHAAFPVLFLSYLLVSLAAYGRCGDRTPTYLLDVLPSGPLARCASVFMLVHMMVSYTIANQVLARAMLLLSGCTTGLEPGLTGRLIWFTQTSAQALFAIVLSNAIPLFDDFVSVIGGLLSTQFSFVFPAGLFLLFAQTGRGVGKVMIIACAFVIVVGVVFTVVGTVSNIRRIADDAKTGGAPFACNLAS
mmetsp:Transcript_64333/g.172224  ORF Transcript_64333/g.172224 Transcript_64333/m.172224 type:complete len:468 (+) Transcript_64333:51-1454(+)